MKYLGLEVPSLGSSPLKPPKSKSSYLAQKEFSRFLPCSSESALPHPNLSNHKRSKHVMHGLKPSKSLPIHRSIDPECFLKSKSEPHQIEEISKLKMKSKFCSNNSSVPTQSRHQFNPFQGGEVVIEKKAMDSSSSNLGLEKNKEILESIASPKPPQKEKSIKCVFGSNKNSSPTRYGTYNNMLEKAPFCTAPIECDPFCHHSVSHQDINDPSNVCQVCNSVILCAFIPPLPLDSKARIEIKLNQTSNENSDESDIDISSLDVVPLKTCGSFTIPSSNSSFLPMSAIKKA